MDESSHQTRPYGSMEDLPSVIEARQMLAGMRLLGWIGGRKVRQEVRELRTRLDDMTSVIEHFYAVLGGRGWIFHDDLNLSAMREIGESRDPDTAEQRLIAYYMSEDHLQWSLRRLGHHEAMRPRMALAQRALHDYQEGRYYSCVLVLLSVMDGFVNDFEPAQRRGLHARNSDDMSAWDKAAGHHQGLAHAHRTYNRRVSKLDSSEQTELRRHGLVHGMLPNFDNRVIATKAWNMLFAVSDWADGEVARSLPKKDEATLRETLASYARFQAAKQKSEDFQPYEVSSDEEEAIELREFGVARDFLEAWKNRRWGPLGGFFIRFGDQVRNVGKQAQEARSLFDPYALDRWSITKIRRNTSSLAFVEVELVVNGTARSGAIRLVLCEEHNSVELDPDAGHWFVAPYYPDSFWASHDTVSE